MMYNQLVESCFFEPKHSGKIDVSLPFVAYYRGGEKGRGDYFDLYLRCDENENIIQARFKAYGSPYLIASLELLCQELEGTLITNHPHFDDESYLLEKLDIPKNRYPVALLVLDGYREIVLAMLVKLRGKSHD